MGVPLRDLYRVLGTARDRGFLGRLPIEDQIEHSAAFADVVSLLPVPAPSAGVGQEISLAATTSSGVPLLIDLGTGGGIPGLALTVLLTEWRVAMIEASSRRAAFLRMAVARLSLGDRAVVLEARSEEIGRRREWRHAALCVTARSLGRPGVVAECAAPLLQLGGILVVSEPPQDGREDEVGRCSTARWPVDPLGTLGLGRPAICTARGRSFVTISSETLCDERYPRRTGVPQRRPLF